MTLNDAKKKGFEEKLLSMKSRLEGELSRFADPTGVPGDYETRHEEIGSDQDDNATEVEQYVDNLAVEGSLEAQLADVNEALERISAGTYGICSECGKDIEEGRLEAYPAAKECMEHAK